MARNVVKAEMRRRVSGANQAVVADTRPKVERKRKGMASYDRRRAKAEARDGAGRRDGEAIAVACPSRRRGGRNLQRAVGRRRMPAWANRRRAWR